MKIVICQLEHLYEYPPTLNLINNLVNLGYEVTIISINIPNELIDKLKASKVQVVNVIARDLFFKLINKIYSNYLIKCTVIKICPYNCILWTTTDRTAVALKSVLFKYKHIMQLMELIEDYFFSRRIPFIKAELDKVGRNAHAVVVPEYNRAHIQKAWWRLDEVPFVLPNKNEQHPQVRELPLNSPRLALADKKIRETCGKKIILYQGVFSQERKLDAIADAVKILGSDYCLVLMGRSNKILINLEKKYKESIVHIDFISPPDHLYITSHAYIGSLVYTADQPVRHNSILNSLYCAPNKIFEYAGFGLPMIGNDIPGLKNLFESNNMGICAKKMSGHAFAEAIIEIERQYKYFSNNSKKFYNKINTSNCLLEILDSTKNQ